MKYAIRIYAMFTEEEVHLLKEARPNIPMKLRAGYQYELTQTEVLRMRLALFRVPAWIDEDPETNSARRHLYRTLRDIC